MAHLKTLKKEQKYQKNNWDLVVVVAQLVERSLPIPEVHGSNPIISKKIILNICLLYISCIEKTKINKKRPGMAHF